MIRAFLDASVIFSACYSVKGHSQDLLLMAVAGDYQVVCSKLVIEETRRNLASTAPDYLLFLDFALENIPMEFVRPTKKQVLEAASYVDFKDAPIVAAAKRGRVDILITLDKRHLLGKPALSRYAGLEIITPKEAFERITGKN